MDLGIQHKTALIFGAGGELGGAIALALAREGVKVAIADINKEALGETAKKIADVGGKSLSLLWDLGDLSRIDESISSIEAEFESVDILVNNTGGPPTTAAGQNAEIWQQYFNTMVVPVIAITDRVLPAMQRKGWGRIITSTSSGVLAPIPNLAISNALRLGIVGWSKTLSREVAAQGITVNITVPGRIATTRIQALDEAKAKRESRSAADVAAESVSSIPAGRYGSPEEYADAVSFLASTRASYITGSILRVDGGLISGL
ncbi:SDR family oxidoreductase [Paenalcaligenes niemegkensis]|uniref:SDR family oxidoreductase n=1 Tax=Paenalcaligenes niemegkensis TaxID=2895469 RepID=UPI001EE91836|nr:SDR family oxidoreductase [Paenalcaligenes niemegkensis]MCQ9618057.1 SDR family oxidoreductase [Paenalcaligenes niemegkensis]